MIPVTCAGAIVLVYCKGCFTACFYQLLTCYFLRGIFMNCLPEVFADSPFPHCLLVQLIRHFLTSCKASFNQSHHSAKHQWAMQRKSALFRLFSPKINIMEQRIILLWLHIGKKNTSTLWRRELENSLKWRILEKHNFIALMCFCLLH